MIWLVINCNIRSSGVIEFMSALFTRDVVFLDVVPVARLEAFRALNLSRLESFRALKFVGQIGRF